MWLNGLHGAIPLWKPVNLEHDKLRLRDSKTGGRTVPLAPSAVGLLALLPSGKDNP